MAKFPRPPVKGPLVIPSCAEVAMEWTQLDAGVTTRMENVLHGNLTAVGPLNPGIAESIFSALKASTATTAWLAHISTTVSLSGIIVKDLRSANNPSITSSGIAAAGTSAGTVTPQSAALVVTERTQFSGKGFFGRVYLPGLTTDNLATARTWNNTLGPLALAFLNALNSAMTAQGLPWVLAQRALVGNSTPGAPPNLAQNRPAGVIPIQQVIMTDFRVDSQRRRLGR